jgi:hypothetical protein
MREKLEELATDFVGISNDEGQVKRMTDTELIITVLEDLTEKLEDLKDHSHTIS